jgi:P27 family predicted phage terminase small subunit
MANFKRGESAFPVNTGRNRISSVQKDANPKQKKAFTARSLLDNLSVESLPTPDYFDEDEALMWEETCATLASVGVLTSLDSRLLAAWVESWCSYARLRKQLKDEGDRLTTAKGQAQANPLRMALHSELSMFTKISSQLGLCPKGRLELQRLAVFNQTAMQKLNEGSEESDNGHPALAVSF